MELTPINLRLLHVLARHRVRLDDLRQRIRLEVLLAWLLLDPTLSRVLLHALEMVGAPPKLVLSLLEELASLLAHLDHPVWRVPEHLDDPRDLVVLGRAGEQGQAEEQLNHDAPQRPHVDGGGVGQAEQDLGRPVEPGLDIGVDGLALVARGPEIDDLDDGALEVLEEDVLGLQVAVDEPRLVQQGQAIQQLLCKDPDQGGAEAAELVLLDELVQIDAQQLEHQAQVLAVDEGVLESQEMVVVVLVQLGVELAAWLAFSGNGAAQQNVELTYQIQDRHLHHALVEIRCSVLDDLDGDHLLRLHILALHHLAKSALAEDVEDQIPVPEQGKLLAIGITHGEGGGGERGRHTCARPPRTPECR